MATFREDIIAFIKANSAKHAAGNHSNPCGKHQHATEASARVHLDKRRASDNRKLANLLEVYHCQACGYWHIGHNVFANNRRFRRSAKGRQH